MAAAVAAAAAATAAFAASSAALRIRCPWIVGIQVDEVAHRRESLRLVVADRREHLQKFDHLCVGGMAHARTEATRG